MRRCHLRFPNRRICGLHPLVEDGEHACSGHRVWHVSEEFQPVPGPDGSARNVFRANPIAQRSPTAMDNANTQQVGQDRPSHHQPGAGGGVLRPSRTLHAARHGAVRRGTETQGHSNNASGTARAQAPSVRPLYWLYPPGLWRLYQLQGQAQVQRPRRVHSCGNAYPRNRDIVTTMLSASSTILVLGWLT